MPQPGAQREGSKRKRGIGQPGRGSVTPHLFLISEREIPESRTTSTLRTHGFLQHNFTFLLKQRPRTGPRSGRGRPGLLRLPSVPGDRGEMPAAGQTLSDRWPADEAPSLLLVLRQCREVGSPKAPVTGSPPGELLPLRAAGQLAKRPGNWTWLGGRTGCRGAGAEPDPWNKPPSVPCTVGGDAS